MNYQVVNSPQRFHCNFTLKSEQTQNLGRSSYHSDSCQFSCCVDICECKNDTSNEMFYSKITFLILLLVGIITNVSCSTPHAKLANGVQLESSFDQLNWLESFEPSRFVPWSQGLNRTQIVSDRERNRQVLEILYPKGSVGPDSGGAQWISYLPEPSDTMKITDFA